MNDRKGHENRYSFTLYSAGGLFRWVDHGYQKERDYIRTREEEVLDAENQRQRWSMGLGLFATLRELGV